MGRTSGTFCPLPTTWYADSKLRAGLLDRRLAGIATEQLDLRGTAQQAPSNCERAYRRVGARSLWPQSFSVPEVWFLIVLVPGFGCGVCLAGDGGRAVAPGVPGGAPAPTAPAPVTTATFPSNEIRPVISLSPSDHASGSSQGSPAEARGQHGGAGAAVRLGVLGHHNEAILAGAQQLADAAACGVEAAGRSPGDT